jgi:multidrug efflux pump subunit AcrB
MGLQKHKKITRNTSRITDSQTHILNSSLTTRHRAGPFYVLLVLLLTYSLITYLTNESPEGLVPDELLPYITSMVSSKNELNNPATEFLVQQVFGQN